MKEILTHLLNQETLERETTRDIIVGITQEKYPVEQISALLTCLCMRGTTVDELLGFRDGILETGVPALLNAPRYIDIVGTGGTRRILSISPPVPVSLSQVPVTRWQSMAMWPLHR